MSLRYYHEFILNLFISETSLKSYLKLDSNFNSPRSFYFSIKNCMLFSWPDYLTKATYKSTWTDLCGGMNVWLMCKTTFLFTKFTKAKYCQRHCLWNVSFFYESYPLKTSETFQWSIWSFRGFQFLLHLVSRIYVTIIIIIIYYY